MNKLITFLITIVLISCGVETKDRYDCKSHNLIVMGKELQPKSKGDLKEFNYFIHSIDENSNQYRVQCTKEEYQFTLIGQRMKMLVCLVIDTK